MATSRSQTPSALYGSAPAQNEPSYLDQSHLGVDANDFAHRPTNQQESSPFSQSHHSQRLGRFEENFDAHTRGSSIVEGGDAPHRSTSRASTLNQGAAPSRSGTLKKKASVRRSGSMRRSGSRRSLHAGSIHGMNYEDDERQSRRENSVFYTPVPTSGSPTEILANRFQAWRKLLKDLITYFREVALSYEHRGKSLLKVSNVINNTNAPSIFLTEGGLNDANRILRDFHKQSVVEANKARDVENEIVNQLNGLRADLAQKIKEIKSLSSDFKNSVEKEKETTRKCVAALEEALSAVDSDPSAIAGKGDPFVVRLAVDRQVERQIDEENYLHRAYLNIENSGRELESIVVGEIQKAYNALAGILKRDADEMYSTVDKLRSGPVGMPRDLEWNHFVSSDPHFVDPSLPLRRLEEIEYPGRSHPAAAEVRAGMLERKSKYLKSYTPGWYVLSPTHLHEFKSADRIYTQPPVMSLYLPDQKLGSHSQPGSSSHKFMLKGRQTGAMHRGHSWVFRAESYDTMLAWYEDIKNLTEKSGEDRNAFVRKHTRSVSQGSARSVASSEGGLEEDEADQTPYSANQSMMNEAVREDLPQRPSPGGRFPSDLQLERNLQAPLPGSSGSSEVGNDITTASGGLHATFSHPHDRTDRTGQPRYPPSSPFAHNDCAYEKPPDNLSQRQQNIDNMYLQSPQALNDAPYYSNSAPVAYPPEPYQTAPQPPVPSQLYQAVPERTVPPTDLPPIERHESTYGDWMAPSAGGAAAGGLAAGVLRQELRQEPDLPLSDAATQTSRPDPISSFDTSSSAPVSSEPDSLTNTASTLPSTANTDDQSLLEEGKLSLPIHTKQLDGSPVIQEKASMFPGVMRQNTDISVSDLHVPGQYPRMAR
ncbi:hypothetical protein GQ43DRAFT_474790 [Delitschia confertaspora ATCC 74209]|uniref:PH domain-containing protein n=1 Tax=Delitschia confertaspora ATCC 74209 TaxID=1513339 RepID=A0A9P4JJ64_9PLEO|nr:hypothetical protein GQ43DRAFT_474790 [Delitschia confertaspora ATCC 74209]